MRDVGFSYMGTCVIYRVYLQGDDDRLEVSAPGLYVIADFVDIDVVQRGVYLVHHEKRSRSEAV